jgi:predicted dehydrogenase
MLQAHALDRRRFLAGSAAALLARGVWSSTSCAASTSSLEKLQLAAIGVANRAVGNLEGVASEALVALCDVDEDFLGRARQQYPDARVYADYRELIAAERGRVDGVVISTPDHHHALPALLAMRQGMHVYLEKPLAHTVREVRLLTEVAREQGVVTQLGTQIHAGDNYRRVVELVRSGAIGPIDEVHVRVGSQWSGVGRTLTASEPPRHLNWDLWLGPASQRDYSPGNYHPMEWRRWWDFGGGSLGDMGCHYLDLVFWALELTAPTRCAATGASPDPEGCPTGLTVAYDFPANGDRGPLRVTWYDGEHAPPAEAATDLRENGVLFVGRDGRLLADYSRWQLLPAEKFADFSPPAPTLAPSIGHHAEWIAACKQGGSTTCDFAYSGPLTETVLLGNVAYRANATLEWDAPHLRIANAPEAEQFLDKTYRPGWEVTRG